MTLVEQHQSILDAICALPGVERVEVIEERDDDYHACPWDFKAWIYFKGSPDYTVIELY